MRIKRYDATIIICPAISRPGGLGLFLLAVLSATVSGQTVPGFNGLAEVSLVTSMAYVDGRSAGTGNLSADASASFMIKLMTSSTYDEILCPASLGDSVRGSFPSAFISSIYDPAVGQAFQPDSRTDEVWLAHHVIMVGLWWPAFSRAIAYEATADAGHPCPTDARDAFTGRAPGWPLTKACHASPWVANHDRAAQLSRARYVRDGFSNFQTTTPLSLWDRGRGCGRTSPLSLWDRGRGCGRTSPLSLWERGRG